MRYPVTAVTLGSLVLLVLPQCSDPVVGGVVEGPVTDDAGSIMDTGHVPPFADATPDTGDETGDCTFVCSSDLHEVHDCKGKVLTRCPETQGCDPTSGGCVPACESAAANQGSPGCEFYALSPLSSCYAVFVANLWTKPLTIQVEYQGTTANLDTMARITTGSGASIAYSPLPDGQLPPGEVALLFLAGAPTGDCPAGITPATENPWGADGAFHITTDYPAAVYDISPYGGGSSAITGASLLLPTSAWGTNYVSVDPYHYDSMASYHVFSLQLVARDDSTDITIVPAQDIPADSIFGTPALSKNVPATFSLDQGKTLTLWANTGDGLGGSIIGSTKPVGAWTMGMLSIEGCCEDDSHQQIPPVQALGDEYVGVRYRDRYEGIEESPPWRIMGTVNGTTLSYDPSTPSGAPTTLDAGEIVMFETSEPFVVRSQDNLHPLYVSAHMTGCAAYGPDYMKDCRGDPEFVNVVPSKQFLSSYVFFTDSTYPETDIVVVRSRTGGGFEDVVLDCAGTLTDWQNIGTGGQYQYTRVDLVRHVFEPQTYSAGTCDNGRHEIHSKAPFGITVWAWGSAETGTGYPTGFNTQAVSYAYPGGQSVHPVNTVVIPPVPK